MRHIGINKMELDTVLAALRWWQIDFDMAEMRGPIYDEIACDGGMVLDEEGIEALCKRINCTPETVEGNLSRDEFLDQIVNMLKAGKITGPDLQRCVAASYSDSETAIAQAYGAAVATDDDLEADEPYVISHVPPTGEDEHGGAWVQSWVWISNDGGAIEPIPTDQSEQATAKRAATAAGWIWVMDTSPWAEGPGIVHGPSWRGELDVIENDSVYVTWAACVEENRMPIPRPEPEYRPDPECGCADAEPADA